jgi:dihydroorotate dehydrogenase
MSLYSLLRPALFQIDPERAHGLTIAALSMLPRVPPPTQLPRLHCQVAGLDFPNPVGLAAGFDKNAQVPDAMLGLGFGFAEVGTLTPLPQTGNPKPRLFRLVEDRAVINRMGFNNAGFDAAAARLAARAGRVGIVGVNVGANKDSADRLADYAAGVARFAPTSSYITVNISSPNTPGLRALQSRASLDELLSRCVGARGAHRCPLFLKIAPDLEEADLDDIAAVVLAQPIDGVIVSNTTLARPASLRSRWAGEAGGLSGAPLLGPATTMLRALAQRLGGAKPLIGAGGIASGADAYAKIRAGASLVQLYSALVYEGPGLARRICTELDALLARDGFASVTQAVGADL